MRIFHPQIRLVEKSYGNTKRTDSDTSDYMQRSYWNQLVQLKGSLDYLNLYLIQNNRYDRWIRMFLAITSSASICGWIVWSQVPLVWAGVIAVSQLLNVIKDYLPFQERRRKLSDLVSDLEEIFLSGESRWYDVSEGVLSSSEIHDLVMDLKRRKISASNKVFQEYPLPKNQRILA